MKEEHTTDSIIDARRRDERWSKTCISAMEAAIGTSSSA